MLNLLKSNLREYHTRKFSHFLITKFEVNLRHNLRYDRSSETGKLSLPASEPVTDVLDCVH